MWNSKPRCPDDGVHVENHPAACRNPRAGELLGADQRRAQVDAEHRLVAVFGHFEHVDPGAVDQEIGGARLGHRGACLGRIGKVGSNRPATDLGGEAVEIGLRPADRHDIGPALGHLDNSATADPFARAGDDDGFSFELLAHDVRSLSVLCSLRRPLEPRR